MFVSYHIKSKGTNRNKPCLMVIYYVSDDVGTINRMLKHQGVHHTFLHSRSCSEDEFDIEYKPYQRIRVIMYNNYQELIKDEVIYCNDEDHFKKLKLIRDKFKNIFIS